jgi:hypothetical protein
MRENSLNGVAKPLESFSLLPHLPLPLRVLGSRF